MNVINYIQHLERIAQLASICKRETEELSAESNKDQPDIENAAEIMSRLSNHTELLFADVSKIQILLDNG